MGPVVVLGVLVVELPGAGNDARRQWAGRVRRVEHPVSGLVTAGGLAGATLLSAGLAEVLAGARLPRRLAPVAVAALSALLFTGVLWVCAVVQLLIDELPWAVTSMARGDPGALGAARPAGTVARGGRVRGARPRLAGVAAGRGGRRPLGCRGRVGDRHVPPHARAGPDRRGAGGPVLCVPGPDGADRRRRRRGGAGARGAVGWRRGARVRRPVRNGHVGRVPGAEHRPGR